MFKILIDKRCAKCINYLLMFWLSFIFSSQWRPFLQKNKKQRALLRIFLVVSWIQCVYTLFIGELNRGIIPVSHIKKWKMLQDLTMKRVLNVKPIQRAIMKQRWLLSWNSPQVTRLEKSLMQMHCIVHTRLLPYNDA